MPIPKKVLSNVKKNKKANGESGLLTQLLGDTEKFDFLNYTLAFRFLKIKKNILKTIDKRTQGGKLRGLKFDKSIDLSDILGESPNLNAIHAFKWLRIKKNILSKVEKATKNIELDVDSSMSISDILGDSPDQDILTKARFFMIRQGLLNKIAKAAKDYSPINAVNSMLGGEKGGGNIVDSSSEMPETVALNSIEGGTDLSSGATLEELQSINTSIKNIHSYLENQSSDSEGQDIENAREQIKRNERRHKELIAALTGGVGGRGSSSSSSGGGGFEMPSILELAGVKGFFGGKGKGKGKGKVGRLFGGLKNVFKGGKGKLIAGGAAALAGGATLTKAATTASPNVAGKTIVQGVDNVAGTVTKESTGKVLQKSLGKGAGKSLIKKVPIIGLIAGLGFGLKRALGGDFSGAAMEVASGAASLLPGVGTAASAAIDGALIGKDVIGAKKANASDEATKIYSQIGETSSSASASLAAGEEIDPKVKDQIIRGLARTDSSTQVDVARKKLNLRLRAVKAGEMSEEDFDMYIKRALVGATRKAGKVSESDLKGVESLFAEERIGQLKAESSPTETMTGQTSEKTKSKSVSSPTETMTGQLPKRYTAYDKRVDTANNNLARFEKYNDSDFAFSEVDGIGYRRKYNDAEKQKEYEDLLKRQKRVTSRKDYQPVGGVDERSAEYYKQEIQKIVNSGTMEQNHQSGLSSEAEDLKFRYLEAMGYGMRKSYDPEQVQHKDLWTEMFLNANNLVPETGNFDRDAIMLNHLMKGSKAADVTPSPSTSLDNIGSIPSSDGAQLKSAQMENAELKEGGGKQANAIVDASTNVNNSNSSSTVSVTSTPHIDKTQAVFGTTQLAY